MPTPVIMPQLGESVFEGTVEQWLIAEGQPVTEDQPLLTVTTDKVDTDLPAPASGILLKIYVSAGQTVPKGAVLALIGAADEAIPERPPATEVQDARTKSIETGAPQPMPRFNEVHATPVARRFAHQHAVDLREVRGTGPGGRIDREDVEAHLTRNQKAAEDETGLETTIPPQSGRPSGFISPAVARLATELDIDLDQVRGTGRGGRITKKDVRAVTQRRKAAVLQRFPASGLAEQAESPDEETWPLSTMRRTIAEHMVLSKRTSPHVTTVMEADMTRVVQARERLRSEFEQQGVRLTFLPFFIQAVVAGLKAVPEANSSFRDGALLMHRRFHIGIATAIPGGLIVPVIRDADAKSLLELAKAVGDLAGRAREKQLAPDEVQGGTFTITNHGTAGSLLATAIINQPQAGILGIGVIQKRAVVISRGHLLLPDAEDTIAIRPMVYLSFTFDHRVLDGASADRFLAIVKGSLEQ